MTNPAELYSLLEFDKIISHIKQFTLSDLAKEHLDDMEFMHDRSRVERALTEVGELRAILDQDDPFPLHHYSDVRKELDFARIEGNYLNAEALIRIAQLLNTSFRVRSYLQNRKDTYPNLWFHAEHLSAFKSIEKSIRQKIDDQTFEVKDSASPKLNRMRKEMARAEQNARAAVEKQFKFYSQKNYLQENLITLKDGRMVLPVKLEHKGRVKGLVHDHSASGSTLYVEPFESVEFNNEIRRLLGEEAREVERILGELTSLIRSEIKPITQNLAILSRLDFIHAKARFARELECVKPALNETNGLEIRDGKHPLLLLRKERNENVVPLNLKLGEDFNTLVISGPNAGGKTVALKTVGLFCLMIQSGIPIPAHPDSRIRIFEHIFADIGDFQSIEQDLSTFTSHMASIKTILVQADNKSLVLVDEIGVGTDPDEGSAIAVAFLEELTRRGALTIVTTHHGSLKEFAYNTEGVGNGSMDFDVQTLQPTYNFRVGIPGSSYAIEIARRLGIPEDLLARCRELLGAEKSKLEHLILDLEKKVLESEKLNEKLDLEKNRLQGLTNLYKERYEAIKSHEKALKAKASEEAQAILKEANAAVERAIKEIREHQATQDAIKRAKHSIEEQKSKMREELESFEQEEREEAEKPTLTHVEVGQDVFWEKHRSHGKVVSDADASGKVLIQVENFKFRVPVEELRESTKPAQPSKGSTSVKVETRPKSEMLPEINVIGQTLDEAITSADKFLDDALIAGWNQVRIIHGKGTGTLRKGIAEFLEQHPRVKNKKMGAWNQGDLGVTVVELD